MAGKPKHMSQIKQLIQMHQKGAKIKVDKSDHADPPNHTGGWCSSSGSSVRPGSKAFFCWAKALSPSALLIPGLKAGAMEFVFKNSFWVFISYPGLQPGGGRRFCCNGP
jgi:hypothetical protein